MNEYEVYCDYVALKQHFQSARYNYNQFYGKMKNATVSAYKKRRDQYFFKCLAKEKDPHGILLANLIYSDRWIGEIVIDKECYENYKRWQRVNESLTYTFESELSRLDIKKEISAEAGLPPILLKLYRNEISIETVAILMDVARCYSYWNKHLVDDPLWNLISLKLVKYKSFLNYDEKKMRSIVKKYLTANSEEV